MTTKGFITFAQNNSTTDYLQLAYVQALSIKLTQNNNSYAVIVDKNTKTQIQDKHLKVFDYIIDLDFDNSAEDEWKLGNEYQIYELSPYNETIKVESDILFGYSIDRWWDYLQRRDLHFPTFVRDYKNNLIESSAYRDVHQVNNLPNIYSGLFYFKKNDITEKFFYFVKLVYDNWPFYRDYLLKNHCETQLTTDVAFAIAALLFGEENCTYPAFDHICFVHLKGAIQGWGLSVDWRDRVYFENKDLKLKFGFNTQIYPVHYYQKKFITDDIIKYYEDRYRRTFDVDL
ncbi:MAG: hypothetical protein N2235_02960 [Fischerella sp.]|nr:hypothetical protein [Fischerella sp.]